MRIFNYIIAFSLMMLPISAISEDDIKPEELVAKFCYSLEAPTKCKTLSMHPDTILKVEEKAGGGFISDKTKFGQVCTTHIKQAISESKENLSKYCSNVWQKYGCTGTDHKGLIQQDPKKVNRAIMCEYGTGKVTISEGSTQKTDQNALSPCERDLECAAKKTMTNAVADCTGAIENLAGQNGLLVEWQDDWLRMRYEKYYWIKIPKGIIGYFGTRAFAINNWGAKQRIKYVCNWDGKNQKVLDVEILPYE